MKLILGLVLLGLCSGCGTILSHVDEQATGVYSGVRLDAHAIASAGEENHDLPSPWIVVPLCIIDIPLSAVVDTLGVRFHLTDEPSSDTQK
jgi:uncharacterized protein YceK